MMLKNKEETIKEIATTVTNVIKIYSINAEKQVDDKYKLQLTYSILLLTRIFALLKTVADFPSQNEVLDEEFESQILIWQACNSMLAAIQLIRQGYPLEPQFLMRVAIESFSLAISFYCDENAFSSYHDGKLTGNNSVTISKKVIREIGQIYGLLSQVTHPSKKTTGNNYNEQSHSLIIGGGYTDSLSNRVLFNYSLLNYLLLTIWKGTELIFYGFEDNHNFWVENSDGTFNLKLEESIKEIVSNVGKDFELAISSIK